MKWPALNPEFRTLENGMTVGERTERKQGTTKSKHSCVLYADDISREMVLKRVPLFFTATS
jgi:hypothetical protein